MERTFLPAVDLGIQWLADRLLPTFDNLESDADQYADKRMEESAGYADPESCDPAVEAERWMDFGIEFYSMAADFRQTLLNMFAATLFHQFEQALLEMHRKECLRFKPQKEGTNYHLKDVVKWFRDELGIDLKKFPSWKTIFELQCLANTVKHAEGSSSAELKKLRPDLLTSPSVPEEMKDSWLHDGVPLIFTPLMGEGIYVAVADLETYARGLKEFLENLKHALQELMEGDPG